MSLPILSNSTLFIEAQDTGMFLSSIKMTGLPDQVPAAHSYLVIYIISHVPAVIPSGTQRTTPGGVLVGCFFLECNLVANF
jgi:hypothetical protein